MGANAQPWVSQLVQEEAAIGEGSGVQGSASCPSTGLVPRGGSPEKAPISKAANSAPFTSTKYTLFKKKKKRKKETKDKNNKDKKRKQKVKTMMVTVWTRVDSDIS